MKTRFVSEADGWTTGGAIVNSLENLQLIRKVLEDIGSIVVEHGSYRGASAPKRIIFDDFDDFTEYLNSKTSAGDAIDVWSFEAVCTKADKLISGKCPDDQGRVPKRGAY